MHRSPPHADEVSPSLAESGYVVVPNAIDAAHVERLRAFFTDAPAQKDGTQHVKLFDESLATHPAIAHAARVVFEGAPWRCRDMHGRNPLPGFGQQGLHADWMPREPDQPFVIMSALWMLDDFTVANGATRVVPGSHRSTALLPKPLTQPLAHHPREVVVTGTAGSVLVFNGHLWHSGRKNESRGPRRCVQMIMRRT